MDAHEDRRPPLGLHSGFIACASLYPNAPAISFGNSTVSYSMMEEKARRWASAIFRFCERRPRRVGVFACRSQVSYIGTIAALLTGATYVPLNPSYPIERTIAMVRKADLDALIVGEEVVTFMESILERLDDSLVVLVPDVDLEDSFSVRHRVIARRDVERCSTLATIPSCNLLDPAYLLFTSGSTGDPKGVPISHANVLYFLRLNQDRYGITPEDRLTQIFPQTFDLSIFDMFMAWSNGASICVPQTFHVMSPLRYVNEERVTIWFSVPSIVCLSRRKGRLLPNSMPGLRLSLFCGEPLPQVAAEAWQAAAPNSVVENLYGPTELTIACAAYRWRPDISPTECVRDIVPIGRIYQGLHAMVLGEADVPISGNEVGELCVGGAQTFAGYWRDEAKSREKLFEWMGDDGEVIRYYRTGDLVHRLSGGDYVFMGRVDHQIKVLGHRVELGEIEAILMRHPGVLEAAVIGWPVRDGVVEGLVAFVSVDRLDGDGEPFRREVSERLPSYMVPRSVVLLDSLPRTANGKMDRGQLHSWLVDGCVVGKGRLVQ